MGKNTELINKLNKIKQRPLLSGQPDLRRHDDEKPQKSIIQDQDIDSEHEEHLNKDFFESMTYWQFEENRRKNSNVLVEA